MRKLSVRQFATIKRVAQNVNPLVVKKNKLAEKIAKLIEEKGDLEAQIEGHELGVKATTGGYVSEDLVTKVVETTDKMDKDGNPVKVTKYLPTSFVRFSEEDNCYYIPDYTKEEIIQAPSTEGRIGSDFDIDSTLIQTEN